MTIWASPNFFRTTSAMAGLGGRGDDPGDDQGKGQVPRAARGTQQRGVATILSARTTDRRVSEVTPVLFSRYSTADDCAAADALCDRFGGEVPGTLEELVTLPGVGRKTASVVLGEAFGKPGVVVDTHVARLPRRFGWGFCGALLLVDWNSGHSISETTWDSPKTLAASRSVAARVRVETVKSTECGIRALEEYDLVFNNARIGGV